MQPRHVQKTKTKLIAVLRESTTATSLPIIKNYFQRSPLSTTTTATIRIKDPLIRQLDKAAHTLQLSKVVTRMIFQHPFTIQITISVIKLATKIKANIIIRIKITDTTLATVKCQSLKKPFLKVSIQCMTNLTILLVGLLHLNANLLTWTSFLKNNFPQMMNLSSRLVKSTRLIIINPPYNWDAPEDNNNMTISDNSETYTVPPHIPSKDTNPAKRPATSSAKDTPEYKILKAEFDRVTTFSQTQQAMYHELKRDFAQLSSQFQAAIQQAQTGPAQ